MVRNSYKSSVFIVFRSTFQIYMRCCSLLAIFFRNINLDFFPGFNLISILKGIILCYYLIFDEKLKALIFPIAYFAY